MKSSALTFGIYPLSPAGTPTGLATGPEDDYGRIQLALQDLRGGNGTIVPRNYLVHTGARSEATNFSQGDRLLEHGLLGDLVIGSMQDADWDLDRWLDFVRKVVARYGPHLSSLQITNEPNLSFMEGAMPYTRQLLIEGVIAAKQEAQALHLPLEIGFGSVPDSAVAVPRFWEDLAEQGGKRWADCVDFVGHNFYVDVFEDALLELSELPGSVERTLRNLREVDLTKAGIPASVPIRVTENGWPTGRNPLSQVERTYERQVDVLESVVRTIHRLRQELHISRYVWFGLRDADSAKEDLFHQFGILRDDYSPKPAYATFKRLVRELGAE